MSAPIPNSASGLLCYVVDDEDRTRRVRSLLWPVAAIMIAVAALVVVSPLACGLVSLVSCGVAGARWSLGLLRNRRDSQLSRSDKSIGLESEREDA